MVRYIYADVFALGYRSDSLSIDRTDKTYSSSLSDYRDRSILIADDVHIALFVFADAADRNRRIDKQRVLPPILCARIRTLQPPNPPAAEIGVEEYTLQTRHLGSTIDNPAHNRAPLRMVIFGHRQRQVFRATRQGRRGEASTCFHNEPSVVYAPGAGCGLVVHLFVAGVTHIRDIESAGLLIKGKTPGIAQHPAPRFRRDSPQPARMGC